MPDMRAEYSPTRSEGVDEERDTFVVGPAGERICYIPATQAPFIGQRRSQADRWSIAQLIARLLVEESARCRAAGVPIDDLRTTARTIGDMADAPAVDGKQEKFE